MKNIYANMINSKDQQKNPENDESNHESDLENRNNESKIELSNIYGFKFLKGDPRTKQHNIQSTNRLENTYPGNCPAQTKNLSLPDSKLLKTKLVEDLDIKSPNIENSRVEINKDQDSTSPKSIRSESLENLYKASTEDSEKSQQSQPKEASDNDSLSEDGSPQSLGAGSSSQQNQVNDGTDTYPFISSGSLESLCNVLTDVSENSEKSQLKEISDNCSLSDDGNRSLAIGPSREQNLVSDDTDTTPSTEDNYGLGTNSTDFGDISEATSDSMDTILRVQSKKKKKKKPKASNESENESLEDSPVRKSNIFFPIRSESSGEETETTTTDDLRLTPFENQQIPSWPSNKIPTFSEDQNSVNSETTDNVSICNNLENSNTSNDRFSMNKLHYSEASDDQLSLNKCDNPEKPEKLTMNKSKSFKNSETPNNESITKKSFGICEKIVEESTKNKSNNPETSDDESLMDISDNLETSESEGDKHHNSESELEMFLEALEVKPKNSQKRKLSTINEEAEESENIVKQVRPSKKDSQRN